MAKYPNRGDNCEQENCMWHVDGWCDRPNTMSCEMDAEESELGKMSEKISARQQIRNVANFLNDNARESGKKIADQISSAVNTMSLNPHAVAVAMGQEHNTLQQSFTGICLAWLKYLATDETIQRCADDRNKASIERAKDIYEACKTSMCGDNILDEPLPFI